MANLDIPSSLILIWDVKRALEKQQSMNVGVRNFQERRLSDTFARQFEKWWAEQQLISAQSTQSIYQPQNNTALNAFKPHQRCLLELVAKGLQGMPIYENLKALEGEFIIFCEEDIQTHVLKLPLLLQIPLLGLLFPAILLLLVIPALNLLKM